VKVRSITQRRGTTLKPFAVVGAFDDFHRDCRGLFDSGHGPSGVAAVGPDPVDAGEPFPRQGPVAAARHLDPGCWRW
jgi:hypothetical protein